MSYGFESWADSISRPGIRTLEKGLTECVMSVHDCITGLKHAN
jgi:hypothetical protein